MIETGPVMYVCPFCGPKYTMFVGRIISRVCESCRDDQCRQSASPPRVCPTCGK